MISSVTETEEIKNLRGVRLDETSPLSFSNLKVSHATCNFAKRSVSLEEWFQSYKYKRIVESKIVE